MEETYSLPNASPATMSKLKRIVPRPVKHAIKEAIRERRFRRALQNITKLSDGELPSRDLLIELQMGWGNEGYAAKYDYLEEVIKRAYLSKGPILECGSGLTSILLGLLVGRRGVEIWSLEHISEWHARVGMLLEQHRVHGVHLCLAPLREYGDFSWYDPPLDALPKNFSLVVCDGPPGNTPGGRYGLLPLLCSYLQAGALVLLDDAERPGETETLNRWMAEKNVRAAVCDTPTGAFALVNYGQA